MNSDALPTSHVTIGNGDDGSRGEGTNHPTVLGLFRRCTRYEYIRLNSLRLAGGGCVDIAKCGVDIAECGVGIAECGVGNFRIDISDGVAYLSEN